MPVHGYMITLLESFYDFTWRTTPSLNELFEIKNELKKVHIGPYLYMLRQYKNAKKQIFLREKLAGNSKSLANS